MIGFRAGRASRAPSCSYSYERVGISNLNEAYTDPELADRNPFLTDALLLGTQAASGPSARSRRASSTTRSTTRSSRPPGGASRVSFDLAGLGGNTSFYKPRLEAIQYFQQTRKHVGRRPRPVRVRRAVAATRSSLPIFERLVPAASTRSAATTSAPSARATASPGLVIGGNKSLLFNGEYSIQIAGPVRAAGVLRRRPGPRRRPELPRRTPSSPRRAPRSGSSCRC